MAEPSAPPLDSQHAELGVCWPDALAATAFAMARRFDAGGTLWVWSPTWPWHAHHVAVEFVHPVVVGTRALDAVAVPDTSRDPTGWLRVAVGPDDALLVLAAADEPTVPRLLRRAAAWGLTAIWIGAGALPPAGAADHVLFSGKDPDAVYDGSLVLTYHLLWELTQICLEHPGLIRTPGPAAEAPVCVTCSDEGRLAEVVHAGSESALVRTSVGTESVDVTLVGPVHPGSLVVVHAGIAIATVDDPPAGLEPASVRGSVL